MNKCLYVVVTLKGTFTYEFVENIAVDHVVNRCMDEELIGTEGVINVFVTDDYVEYKQGWVKQ